MPLSFDDAFNATDPSLSDDARKESAQRLQEGVRANEIYWDSRSDLEALRAQATGHGVVVRNVDEEGDSPTVAAAQTEPAIDSTATEEQATALAPGQSETADAPAPPAPSPDNSNESIARLRAQVESLGGTPEA